MRPVLIEMDSSSWLGLELYPEPETSSGYKLLQIMNEKFSISKSDYIKIFDRRNLIRRGTTAEQVVEEFLQEFTHSGRTIILLGEDTHRLFNFKNRIFECIEYLGCTWCLLPHPSGGNLKISQTANRMKTAAILELIYNQFKNNST